MIVLLIYQSDLKKPYKEKSSRMDYFTESPVLLRGVNKKCDEDGLRWDKSIFRLIRELPLQS